MPNWKPSRDDLMRRAMTAEAEVERLRQVVQSKIEGKQRLREENERLRADLERRNQRIGGLEDTVERCRATNDAGWSAYGREAAKVVRLQARIGRLRKAVTWLVGALPNDPEFDWERGRAQEVLNERP